MCPRPLTHCGPGPVEWAGPLSPKQQQQPLQAPPHGSREAGGRGRWWERRGDHWVAIAGLCGQDQPTCREETTSTQVRSNMRQVWLNNPVCCRWGGEGEGLGEGEEEVEGLGEREVKQTGLKCCKIWKCLHMTAVMMRRRRRRERKGGGGGGQFHWLTPPSRDQGQLVS